MEYPYKIVGFEKYCPKCKYRDILEEKDPCHKCLSEPTNLYSHKPVEWAVKDDGK